MQCDNCGTKFDINPAGGKSEMASRQGADVIATKTATLVDSKRNSSLIFIMECPSCHRLKSVMAPYEKLIDLPSVDELEAIRFSSAPPRGGIPHHVPAREQGVDI